MSKEIAALHLHISNGGVEFSVEDNGRGPLVVIESSNFGNNKCRREVAVERETLSALAKMFQYASEYEWFSEPYCCSARLESISPSCLIPELANRIGYGSVDCEDDSDSDDRHLSDDEYRPFRLDDNLFAWCLLSISAHTPKSSHLPKSIYKNLPNLVDPKNPASACYYNTEEDAIKALREALSRSRDM
jgi:hypothetical protein